MQDLHIHSTHSDGELTVKEIFEYCKNNEIKTISITDHDSIDAIEEAEILSKQYEINFIPGIEISSSFLDYEEIHILGLFIDYKNEDLKNFINTLKKYREDRNIKIIQDANIRGYEINEEELKEWTGKKLENIGKPDFASYFVNKKYFSNRFEAFKKYLDNKEFKDKFTRQKIEISQTIDIIKKADGISILAHPFNICKKRKDLEKIIREIIELGINGIEIYYNGYSSNKIKFLRNIAKSATLVTTGGSDFHTFQYRNSKIGYYNNFKPIPNSVMRNIFTKYPYYQKYIIYK